MTTQPAEGETLFEIKNLKMHFPIFKGVLVRKQVSSVKAVDGLTFEVRRGETLGLVGESGCGKSTTGRAILQLYKPTEGEVHFRGKNLCELDEKSLHGMRRHMQMIFQDPYASLNPRMTVFDIIAEPIETHKILTDKNAVLARVQELMTTVGLDPRFVRRYPHEFSGGQRQRIGIARALALQPDLLICDEPVSALDVSIQAQVLNLLKDLKQELGLTYLFISHNLAVIDYMADRIAVMCQGRLVETAERAELFKNPVHPYTQALLNAVPKPDPNDRLDLTALMEGKASIPAEWPAPFTVDGTKQLNLIDIGGGHLVRALPDSGLGEIAA